MKRGGFALIIYILYTVVMGGYTLWFAFNFKIGSPDSLGVIFTYIIGVFGIYAVGGLIAVILKLLHMSTGWLLFGILCILIDCLAILAFGMALDTADGINPIFVPFIAAFVCALVSNAVSLKN